VEWRFLIHSVVLNLPKEASQEEIRERYRALSLIYHPDKQHDLDSSTKATAEKRFLEVQKAYEGTCFFLLFLTHVELY
jgi:DnaJ-class molecular chaperone